MAGRSNADHYREIAAFVGDETHGFKPSLDRSAEHDFFMREGIRGVTKCRMDVVRSEFRICLAEILLVRPFSQLANDQFYRNPGPSDHRLAQHDSRIDLDSVVNGHLRVAPESQDQASVQMALDSILAQGPYAGDVAPDPVFKDKMAFLGMDLLLIRVPRGVDCTHAANPRGPVFERIKIPPYCLPRYRTHGVIIRDRPSLRFEVELPPFGESELATALQSEEQQS